jgi:hypothetical protein
MKLYYIILYILIHIYIFGLIHRSTAHCLICVTPEVQHPNIVAQDVLKAIASLKEGQAEVSVGAVNGPKMTVVSGLDFDDLGTERRLELC